MVLDIYNRPSWPVNSVQEIAAATGTVNVGTSLCRIDYTGTGAVTDIEFSDACVAAAQTTMFVDEDGNAGTNNITIKTTADVVIAVIASDSGSVTIASDGLTPYVV